MSQEKKMKKTHFKIKNIKAFSLPELSVAMGILAFVVSSLLYFFISAMLMNEANSEMIIASHDAEYVLEQVKDLPVNNFTALDAYAVPPQLTNPATRKLRNESIAIDTGSGFNLRNVGVTVTWNERNNRVRNFVLTTQIASTN